MEVLIGGQRRASVVGDRPGEIAEHPSRFSEDGGHGGDVPSVDDWVHHGVGSPGGHQRIAVSVTPGSDDDVSFDQLVDHGGRWPIVDPTSHDAGSREVGAFGDPGRLTVGETASPSARPDALV